MRPLVLAALLASAFAAPAFAQNAPPESAPLPHRQGLSMEMPKMAEDAALQAAVASTTRPEADRARDSQRHPFETLTFWGLQPGLTVVDLVIAADLETFTRAWMGYIGMADAPAREGIAFEGPLDVAERAKALLGLFDRPRERKLVFGPPEMLDA